MVSAQLRCNFTCATGGASDQSVAGDRRSTVVIGRHCSLLLLSMCGRCIESVIADDQVLFALSASFAERSNVNDLLEHFTREDVTVGFSV